ncbi:MAG: DEAD/DEAH box helicase [Steroidobacteraceae bacterium]
MVKRATIPLAPLKLAHKFRDYQRAAIRMARRYGIAFKDGQTHGAALVCHPTGTGKTAVIAALAQCCPEIGSVLVLTTREAVRDQLVRELAGDIFLNREKFGCGARLELPKCVLAFRSLTDAFDEAASVHRSTLRLIPKANREFADRTFARTVAKAADTLMSVFSQGKSVLVMTVQMLALLAREDPTSNPTYGELANADLIIFDEGHYEPAVFWSQVVRGLDRPLVLLSATPYRNDLKPFQITAGNVHVYQYGAARAAPYVRTVRVEARESQPTAAAFRDDMLDFCADKFGADRQTWPRVIIHCDESNRIIQLARAFIELGFRTIGIHDKFRDPPAGEDWQFHTVPPPRETDAQIWIHQFKLMEGIDDHRFRVLAFFDLMTNLRSVVQQIGRIIRPTPGGGAEDAYVLDHYKGRLRQYWDLYKDYDEGLTAELLTKSLSRFYVDKFIEAHPPVDYIARKFRRRLVIEEVSDATDEILFERRVSFRVADPTASLADYEDILKDQLAVADLRYWKAWSSAEAVIYLYVGIESPSFLNSPASSPRRATARAF